MKQKAVCLMGPTATGKTDIAIALCKRFPFEIISVDSALVYRGMDIGTAKPDPATLARTPHRLVDIRDPEDPYSAGDFVRDAHAAIAEITASGRIPLLAGGTMMYFRALTRGIAELPSAEPALRAKIDAEAAKAGWPALHAELQSVDPEAAARIEPNDRQRIQRALEVYRASGVTMSEWQRAADENAAAGDTAFIRTALNIEPRKRLHERIDLRLKVMLNKGFVDEVKALRERPGLDRDAPSMRSVGYRQFWSYLEGESSLEEATYRTLVATRQLAKRQVTWLRSETGVTFFDPLEENVVDAISAYLIPFFDA
ncbi:MAG: tRNA (adenosine(37)-N6)-dimethylallyltransferase MiaA [Woeseiaceae bacterium]|nr:tRNA (adenosine(37)-N6)-dimethylallyltransferase MiaA [Woeseiaceae bacterium]